MKICAGDIVAVAEAWAQFRAAVLHAGIVIGAAGHVDAPDAARDLDLSCSKARCFAEELRRLLCENARHFFVNARYAHKLLNNTLEPPCAFLHIAVDGLQRLVLGHDGLQGLVGSDAGQNLTFQMELFFFRRVQMH